MQLQMNATRLHAPVLVGLYYQIPASLTLASFLAPRTCFCRLPFLFAQHKSSCPPLISDLYREFKQYYQQPHNT